MFGALNAELQNLFAFERALPKQQSILCSLPHPEYSRQLASATEKAYQGEDFENDY